MAEVTAFTAERSQAIEDGAITAARLDGYDLILTPTGFASDPGTYPEINVGNVRGATGPQGPVGEVTEVELAAAVTAAVPPGIMQMYAGAAAPSGYLLCDGAAVNRTTYAALFAAIGTVWGAGDGSTTFNVPDYRDRFPVGKGTAGYSDTLGEAGGDKDAIVPAHVHTGPSHQHTGPSHQHTGPSHQHTVDPPSTLTTTNGDHDHEPGVGDAFIAQTGGGPGSGQLVASGGYISTINPLSTNVAGNHQHSVDIGSFNTGAEGTGLTGSGGTGLTGASGTGNTGSTGEAVTDKNLPPYRVINFIIKT